MMGPGQMMGGHWNKEDMHKHFAEMCQDAYPKAVGKLAYLEAKLQLSSMQKPLFDRWRSTMLAIVKTRTAKCGDMKLSGDEDIVAMTEHKEARLKAQIADIDAQMPALKALAGSLSDEQKHTLLEVHHQMMMERGHRMMGGMRFMMMHHMDRGHGEPPPPAQ